MPVAIQFAVEKAAVERVQDEMENHEPKALVTKTTSVHFFRTHYYEVVRKNDCLC
jgi:V8-like Glu-specific endopeptidase